VLNKPDIVGSRGFRIMRLESRDRSHAVLEGWKDGARHDLWEKIMALVEADLDQQLQDIKGALADLGVVLG
jgi:hypothetical protein